MSKKALVAMSGGVDSSVALYLMKQQGYDVTGIMMRRFDCGDAVTHNNNITSKSSDSALNDARNVATSLGATFYEYDFSTDFNRQVIIPFIDAYQKGTTPNPCVECNRLIKFGKLYSQINELGVDFFATGHYAQIVYDEDSGRYLLKRAADKSKDQSYVLYSLKQEQLARTQFPLGKLQKSHVREIAREQNLINAKQSDSQDICFVSDGDYADFIERYVGKSCEDGDFIDIHGKKLGRHNGHIRYTIGQRKGLGLSFEKPMYVHSKNASENTVTLCKESELYSKSLIAECFNWIAFEKVRNPIRALAKIRYSAVPSQATITPINEDTVRVDFDEPVRAIASGQSVVLYSSDGDTILGGGVITAGL
jgi:tRNA-specific 2-thiouridylase